MPPKNMISVTRNSHMPSEAAFFCCCASAKWWSKAGLCASCSIVAVPAAAPGVGLVCNGSLQFLRRRNLVVVISFPGHNRGLIKIKCWWRRRRLPLEPCRSPRIRARDRAVFQRPEQINHGQQIADGEHTGSGGRQHVQHLKLRRILPIASRHADLPQDELREERQVEADEHEHR